MRRCPRGFPLLLLVAAFIANGSVVDACLDEGNPCLPGTAGLDRHDNLVLCLNDTGDERLRAASLLSDEPDFHFDRIFRAESVLDKETVFISLQPRRFGFDPYGPLQAMSAIGEFHLLSRPPPSK